MDRLGQLVRGVHGGVAGAVIAMAGGQAERRGRPLAGRRRHLDPQDRSLRRAKRQVKRPGDRDPGHRLAVQPGGRLADALEDPSAVRPHQPGVLAGDGRVAHRDVVVGRAADPDRLSGLENIGPAVNEETQLAARGGDLGRMGGAAGRQYSQSAGAAGQDGSGCQPGGGRHPAGTAGHPGGALNVHAASSAPAAGGVESGYVIARPACPHAVAFPKSIANGR